MGHALEKNLHDARKQLATTQGELHDRTRWALSLDADLQDLKPRFEQLESLHEEMLASLSWRITRPLRSAKARLRTLRAALTFRANHLRSVAARTRGSLAQRGLRGTIARIAQEWRTPSPAFAAKTYTAPVDDAAPFAVPTSARRACRS
jgi:chromosome segregation ATPase